jgi:hypothetical protein
MEEMVAAIYTWIGKAGHEDDAAALALWALRLRNDEELPTEASKSQHREETSLPASQ